MCATVFNSAILLALSGGAAHAQSAPPIQGKTTPGSAGPADATSIGEVVVTATKRTELLRDIPDSVAVVTGASLQAGGPIIDIGTVLSSVPG